MRPLRVYVRGLTLFGVGIVVGTFLMQPGSAQESRVAGLRLNHVGIAVRDFDESLNFYTKVMGFRIAFQTPGPVGRPATTYLQISRDTFLELAPASANLPAGITHIGIESPDVKTTVAELRQVGATLQDPRVGGNSKAVLSNITDPSGIRLELIEITPDSLHKKAEESWK